MHHLVKVGAVTLGFGALGGTAYAYTHFTKDSFANTLGKSVLDLTGDTNSTEWRNRLTELKAKTPKPAGELLTLINKEAKDLQAWCNYNSTTKFNDKEDGNYRSFEEFCTWKIGDKPWDKKIEPTVKETEDRWKKAYDALKAVGKDKVSADLQKILESGEDAEANKKAMHKWCTDNYKKTWKDDSQSSFVDVQKYCKTT